MNRRLPRHRDNYTLHRILGLAIFYSYIAYPYWVGRAGELHENIIIIKQQMGINNHQCAYILDLLSEWQTSDSDEQRCRTDVLANAVLRE